MRTSQGFDAPLPASAAGRLRVAKASPPLKKRQRLGDSALAALLRNAHKRDRLAKSSFPAPSARRSKAVVVRDLPGLRKTWETIRDRKATRSAALKEAFDKELFARAIARAGGGSLALRLKELA
jgi:hypothetical protein